MTPFRNPDPMPDLVPEDRATPMDIAIIVAMVVVTCAGLVVIETASALRGLNPFRKKGGGA